MTTIENIIKNIIEATHPISVRNPKDFSITIADDPIDKERLVKSYEGHSYGHMIGMDVIQLMVYSDTDGLVEIQVPTYYNQNGQHVFTVGDGAEPIGDLLPEDIEYTHVLEYILSKGEDYKGEWECEQFTIYPK